MFPTPAAPLLNAVPTVTGSLDMVGLLWGALGVATFVAAALGFKLWPRFVHAVLSFFHR